MKNYVIELKKTTGEVVYCSKAVLARDPGDAVLVFKSHTLGLSGNLTTDMDLCNHNDAFVKHMQSLGYTPGIRAKEIPSDKAAFNGFRMGTILDSVVDIPCAFGGSYVGSEIDADPEVAAGKAMAKLADDMTV